MTENLASKILFVTNGTGCRGGVSMGKVWINLREIWDIISEKTEDSNKFDKFACVRTGYIELHAHCDSCR